MVKTNTIYIGINKPHRLYVMLPKNKPGDVPAEDFRYVVLSFYKKNSNDKIEPVFQNAFYFRNLAEQREFIMAVCGEDPLTISSVEFLVMSFVSKFKIK